ncbi:hypothetical protein BCR33DRAFT_716492 [Rhizoclosmatium globosum]|uniref:CAP-Gly domain-containing protein n=1 Tax=Rhizoclosmatium globosum TaxID=329046 RepID=A0A1Y2CDM5_9FUNG|nr:hypothetical protein BCR33DRAFT_716492 [Rhizoclosmatium globosum]|eukprot:ORY45160.1 hypothetical protein BCR33DRAFT_716492 [Rhizoclosmatium globosum]
MRLVTPRSALVTVTILLLLAVISILEFARNQNPVLPLVNDGLERNPLVNNSQHSQQLKPTRGKYPNIAIALKTGSETAASRSAIQILTFLKDVSNLLVVAEAPGHKIGEVVVEDVYNGVYEAAQERLRVKESQRLLARRGVLEKDQSVAGQHAKCHKNLPAFQLLQTRYPNADWYIMFDDDSFVFLENLAAYLHSRRKPPILHWPINRFKGCDGPRFAQGGAGIVISRGALSRANIDACTLKYKSCWAGDIRVGLCMRDAGVLVQHREGFYGLPPNAQFVWPDRGCSIPFVFHHALPRQVQALWDVQRWVSARNRGVEKTRKEEESEAGVFDVVTMADLYQYLHTEDPRIRVTANELRMQNNTDVRGRAVQYQEVTSPELCLSACEEDEKCVGWTYDIATHWCWMKYGPGKMENRDGMWGGVLLERYKCEDPLAGVMGVGNGTRNGVRF